MAGVRRWMSAQPPPSVLKSVKNTKPGHSHRKPDLTTEPERDIDPTSTEGMVRRLLEPSVDRAEEKEYERCAFLTLCNGMNSDSVIQSDMSTSTRRSSHAATRTSTKRICMKQTCRSTVPTYRYAKQPLRTGRSTGRSPKAPSTIGNEQQRMFIRHTCCNQSVLCVFVGIVVLGVLVISMGGG